MRLSNESHLYWKKHFHKNPLSFRIYADCEADNEIDKPHIGNKTIKFHEQNPVVNACNIISELDDVLKNGYRKPLLRCISLDWL